jgi:hypothetical protein
MSIEWRKITDDDYIPDFIKTINRNFESLVEAINDLNEIINDGDAELKTLTIGQGVTDTEEVTYNGYGKLLNQGTIETASKLKSNGTLEVKGVSSFNGTSTFSDEVNVNDDANFTGDVVVMDSLFDIRKSIKYPKRIITTASETDNLGNAENGYYPINVEGDLIIILNELDTTFVSKRFNLINAQNQQVVKFVSKKYNSSTDKAYIKLIDDNTFELSEKSSVTLTWNQPENSTGEWIVLDYSKWI